MKILNLPEYDAVTNKYIKYNLKEITQICRGKFILQRYDLAPVINDQISSIQKHLKNKYKNTSFVHYYVYLSNLN